MGLLIVLAACGSDGSTVSSDDAEGSSGLPIDTNEPDNGGPLREGVLARANINGELFGGKRHAIDNIAIAESFPEQIQLTFTSGAEPCLAADATATAVGDEIIVELIVGLPADAALISCIHVVEQHFMSLQLSEGINGREVVLAEADEAGEQLDPPPAQPFETTLIGMNEQSAEEGAESFGYEWRVVQRDGESIGGDDDLREDRINATIVDGVVVEAFVG